MSEKRCYYEVLGCSKGASSEELRKAYKREALKHHPDRNPGDQEAEARFKEANEAFQVLSDDQKRQIYDQFGHEGLQGGAGGGDPGDVFSHMQDLFNEMFSGGFGFGGGGRRQARGADLRMQEKLTLREAAFGVKREVSVRAPTACEPCGGSGAAAGTKPETCGQCRGSGQVSAARGFMMFTSPCPRCQGAGVVIKTPCGECRGQGMVEKTRKVTVTFPAGIDGGQRLRVPQQGVPGPRGTPPGDLYVDIVVEDDPRFERDGADLATRISITFADAALGAEVNVPALSAEDPDAKIQLKIPAGTQPGAVLSVRGQGVPRLDGRGRGQLAVVVDVDVPKSLSSRAKELLRELDAELRQGGATREAAAGARG
jgi:molecular chaperone DnaJ